MIPSILLERHLLFEKQIFPQLVESLIFNVIIVFLASRGFGLASYSWSILISALAGLPIYFIVSPWKPQFSISKESMVHLFGFGLPFQGKSILAVLKDDLLTFFLVGLVGPAGIGYWGWAQRWSYFPFRFIVDSVTKVTFPAYARIHHESIQLQTAIEKSIFGVSALLFPILTLMSLSLPKLLVLIPRYAKWEPAIISFYFLSAGAAISAISNILVNVLDATGRVRMTLGLMVLWIVLMWVFTILLVTRFGVNGIAIASFLVSLSLVLTIYLVKRVINFRLIANLWKQVVSCCIMGVSLVILNTFLSVNYFSVTASLLIGVIVYLSVMFILAKKQLLADLAIIKSVYLK